MKKYQHSTCSGYLTLLVHFHYFTFLLLFYLDNERSSFDWGYSSYIINNMCQRKLVRSPAKRSQNECDKNHLSAVLSMRNKAGLANEGTSSTQEEGTLWTTCDASVKSRNTSVQQAVRISVAHKLYQWIGQHPPPVTVNPGQETKPSDCHPQDPFFTLQHWTLRSSLLRATKVERKGRQNTQSCDRSRLRAIIGEQHLTSRILLFLIVCSCPFRC